MTLDLSGIGNDPATSEGDSHRHGDPAVAEAIVSAAGQLSAHRVLGIGAGILCHFEALARRGFETLVLDSNETRLARFRHERPFEAVCASVLALPFARGSIDCVIVPDISGEAEDLFDAVFREFRRVARFGAILGATTRDKFQGLWYRHYFPQIDSLLRSSYPALGTIVTAALRGGFIRCTSKAIVRASARYSAFEAARNRPELLFDERFRRALAGFAALDEHAINAGLKALRCDLECGRFNQVRESFESLRIGRADCFVVTAYTG